jgi:DNA-binding beta-propeller fold protein YncE
VIQGPATGLNDPTGLAVSRDGSLFVANAGSKNVLVFARGSSGDTAPVARIDGPATQLIEPQALAIDASGRLYVFDGPRTTSALGCKHYVRVYAANARGNVAPLQSYEVNTKCWANAV